MIPDDDLIYNNGCISARRVGAELLSDPSIGRGPAHHHTLSTHLLHSISCIRTGALAPIGMSIYSSSSSSSSSSLSSSSSSYPSSSSSYPSSSSSYPSSSLSSLSVFVIVFNLLLLLLLLCSYSRTVRSCLYFTYRSIK